MHKYDSGLTIDADNMNRYKSFLSHGVLALQALLLVAVVFYDYLTLPSWLATTGRLHPLLLHFPIVLALMLSVTALLPVAWREDTRIATAIDWLWLHAAGLSALTALSGLFLSQEGGYDAAILTRHMWLGAATSFVTYTIWATLSLQRFPRVVRGLLTAGCLASLVWAGHEGGTLTHGQDFLSFNSNPSKEDTSEMVIANDSTPIFQAAIQPIFEKKCQSCHNDQKAKGDFVMTRTDLLLKGGKEGAPWVAGNPDSSHLIQRILLSLEDEKHMPPKGKAQLSDREIALLHQWVAAGANLRIKLDDLPATDSFRVLAASFFPQPAKTSERQKSYGFPAADAAVIQSLNGPFRIVVPVDAKSPALEISFFVSSEYKPEMLAACLPVAQQTVRVNLSGMPAGDEVFPVLAEFPNLEYLNLNSTQVSGKGLASLSRQRSLRRLSLANTSVTLSDLQQLAPFGTLEEVKLWRSRVTPAEVRILAQQFPKVRFDIGQLPDTSERLRLTPPSLKKPDKTVFALGEMLELKHPMPGVTIRYTTDGSAPDSNASSVYRAPIAVKGPTEVQAIAVMEGWLASNTSLFTVFSRGIKATQATLLTTPDNRYRVQGGASLTDGLKGESKNTLVNWLGFREEPFAALFQFDGRDTIRKVILSMADNNGGYIMPPKKILVTAGSDTSTLILSGTLVPEQPLTYGPVRNRIYTVAVKPGSYRYLRVQADPVSKLPAWHRGKGDKGWVFIDEVFFE